MKPGFLQKLKQATCDSNPNQLCSRNKEKQTQNHKQILRAYEQSKESLEHLNILCSNSMSAGEAKGKASAEEMHQMKTTRKQGTKKTAECTRNKLNSRKWIEV